MVLSLEAASRAPWRDHVTHTAAPRPLAYVEISARAALLARQRPHPPPPPQAAAASSSSSSSSSNRNSNSSTRTRTHTHTTTTRHHRRHVRPRAPPRRRPGLRGLHRDREGEEAPAAAGVRPPRRLDCPGARPAWGWPPLAAHRRGPRRCGLSPPRRPGVGGRRRDGGRVREAADARRQGRLRARLQHLLAGL
ncbi:hypothetical protein BDV95DRAFT_662431, partial [Massariosphaeria phaeospora]